jgi:hypothetical protein
MHGLRGVELFEPVLIGDMHNAYNIACAELGLSSTCDKATTLVVTKVVELEQIPVRSTRSPHAGKNSGIPVC